LAYQQDKLLEELDKTHFLEQPLNLAQRETTLTEDEFPFTLPRGQKLQIYISESNEELSYKIQA